jgi:uncharacterized protein (TIGR03435 family)
MFDAGGPGSSDPGRISYPRESLAQLIVKAYDVKFDQVLGPDWLNTERYSIAATMPPDTTNEQFRTMLQNLLSERFELAFHRATKEFPVYELMVTAGGPKLRQAEPDLTEAPPPTNQPMPSPKLDAAGFPELRPGQRGVGSVRDGMMRSTHRASSMADLVNELSVMVNFATGDLTGPPARVVDKTGLSGSFDFKLEWSPAGMTPAPVVPGPDNAPMAGDSGGGPTLFAALDKQLGLKLVKDKATFEVLVIDHADRTPVAN